MTTMQLWGLWTLMLTLGLPFGALALYAIGMPILNYLKAINLVGRTR